MGRGGVHYKITLNTVPMGRGKTQYRITYKTIPRGVGEKHYRIPLNTIPIRGYNLGLHRTLDLFLFGGGGGKPDKTKN